MRHTRCAVDRRRRSRRDDRCQWSSAGRCLAKLKIHAEAIGDPLLDVLGKPDPALCEFRHRLRKGRGRDEGERLPA